MSLTLPLRPDLPHYDMDVVLDTVTYRLEFRWNTRAAGWFMSVLDDSGSPIASNLRVVVDHPIGGRTRDTRWPPGVFIAVDTTGQHLDPGLLDLGDRVLLLYFTKAELPIDPSAAVV